MKKLVMFFVLLVVAVLLTGCYQTISVDGGKSAGEIQSVGTHYNTTLYCTVIKPNGKPVRIRVKVQMDSDDSGGQIWREDKNATRVVYEVVLDSLKKARK